MDIKFIRETLINSRRMIFWNDDIADQVRENIDAAVLMIDGQKFGCHCDIEAMEDGFEPDGCVIDEGRPQDCIYASCGDKWKCREWRPIKT